MNEISKSDCIVLCDSSSKLEEIDQIIDKYHPLIIAFDYECHNFLLEKNIIHKLSDDYLNDKDLDYIQDLTYQFSNWYNEPEISNLIEYEGINVGELFYLELSYFLTPILKRIFEIQKICQKFKNSFFISSTSLIDILKLFSSNIEKLDNIKKKNISIRNNDISMKFNRFTLTSNSENIILQNIIKLSYTFFNNIFSPKKIDHDKPTILLVNFTTLRLQKVFEELPYHSINLIKYDTIVPAFWNLMTLSLIKKSGCHIENNDTLSKNTDFLFSKNHNSFVNQKLNNLLLNESFFERFFSLNGQIFWNIIKNDFIQIFTRNYNTAIQNVTKVKLLFKKYPFSYIILRSECDPLDLVIINLSKKFGIKIGLFQHALYNDDLQNSNYYAFKSDQFHRVLPLYSDNFLIWDKLTQNHALKHGVDSKKIIPIGNPFFDIFFDDDKNTANLKNEFILLAITPYTNQNQTRELSTKIQIEYETTIEQICQIITKMNKKLLIKIHHGSFFEQKNIKKINPNIVVETTGSFYQYAKNCELLICLDMSTAILDAMLLKKPVVSILIRDKDSHSEIFENNYTVKTEISDLEHVLTNLIHDEKFKKSCIEQGEKFIHDYLLNPGHSTKTLLDFLSNMSINEN